MGTSLRPDSGSTTPPRASRQPFFTGHAVRLAAGALRSELLAVAGALCQLHPNELRLKGRHVVGLYDERIKCPLLELIREASRRGFGLKGQSLFKPRTV